MSNFLLETIRAIKRYQQSISNITFIGSSVTGRSCTWSEFCDLANFKYNCTSGHKVVATDLIIVFKDNTHMSRTTHGKAEYWSYSPHFVPPDKTSSEPIQHIAQKDSDNIRFNVTIHDLHISIEEHIGNSVTKILSEGDTPNLE